MREEDLYPIVEQYLHMQFAPCLKPALGAHLTLAGITATAGPAGSGKWSRPDLALINLWRHKYQPHQSLDVYGFEVKKDGACDLSAVHEALAHTRSVNYSYLVWQYRASDFDAEAFKTIRQNCESYELGLIAFPEARPGTLFKCHVKAQRKSPHASAVDEFIETRFSESQKQRLLAWIREAR